MDVKERALEAHEKWAGKIEVVARCEVNSKDDLSIAYTPGVAEPCLKIKDDPSLSYKYTRRHNLVAVITDGTAVLGLGDIGPLAGMPVMEGKCALFKAFADVDAFPLCVASKDVDEIVRTVQLISGSFGGINLEDIAAPRCFEIERRLKEVCDIPVFHDDQHGTAVCCGAALLNACRLTGRKVDEIKMVVNGCGAAAIAVTRFLMFLGVKDITMVERFGIVCEGDERLIQALVRPGLQTFQHRHDGLQGGKAVFERRLGFLVDIQLRGVFRKLVDEVDALGQVGQDLAARLHQRGDGPEVDGGVGDGRLQDGLRLGEEGLGAELFHVFGVHPAQLVDVEHRGGLGDAGDRIFGTK